MMKVAETKQLRSGLYFSSIWEDYFESRKLYKPVSSFKFGDNTAGEWVQVIQSNDPRNLCAVPWTHSP